MRIDSLAIVELEHNCHEKMVNVLRRSMSEEYDCDDDDDDVQQLEGEIRVQHGR